jgi:hypothetical protein
MEQHTSITNPTTINNNMYHAHDVRQKTTTRGLELYWASVGRTNNNNKFPLPKCSQSSLLPNQTRTRNGI